MRRTSPASVNLSITYHGRRVAVLHVRGWPYLARQDGGGVLLEHARLADDLREDGGRDRSRLHEVAEKVPRPHRRQLVVVADQDDGGLRTVDSLEQPPRERHVHHRDFVDHQDVCLDRVERIAGIGAPVEAQQPVNGAGLMPTTCSSRFAALPSGRGQHYPLLQEVGDGGDG